MDRSRTETVAAILLLCCLQSVELQKDPHMLPGRSVIVHLFEWRYDDIAEECETFLGPHGYGGVQTSPVHEHAIILDDVVKRPWYERYQPVSYKINNRSGNETAFQDMVRRCNKAGVRFLRGTCDIRKVLRLDEDAPRLADKNSRGYIEQAISSAVAYIYSSLVIVFGNRYDTTARHVNGFAASNSNKVSTT